MYRYVIRVTIRYLLGCTLLKAGMPEIESWNTKTRNHQNNLKHWTDKGWFTCTTQAEAEVRWPTTATVCLFLFTILQFAKECQVLTVVSIQYNFDRDQEKSVSMIFIRNLEI